MKYAWMDKQRGLALAEMCEVLDVSVSGYRAWKRGGKPERKRLTDAQMLALIRAIHAEFKGSYGSPRMVRELRLRGYPASKERVERLMQENGIKAKHKRRFKVTTDSKHNLPVAPNVLDRKFIVAAPNQAWDGDFTYIATEEGWLFLAVVIDLFSRKVVGWSMRPDMQRNLVIDALEMAWFKRNPGKNAELIFHSDRGSQYASEDFSEVLKEHGIRPSMSRKSNCWDNACSETLFGSLKVERLHGQRFETIREAKDETIAWLLWYNRTRMHSTLNYISPMQFEQDWMDATVKIAA